MLFKVVCGLAVALVSFFVLGGIGGSDYSEMLEQENHYCEQVHDHVWPDYKKSYHRDCKDGKYVSRN
jgi:major membrane immunogen (membrane-anchored lipoprotein)